jgi:hypothetical protein
VNIALAQDAVASSSLLPIVADLADPRNRIEAVFVTVGEMLTRSAGLLDQISSTFEALPSDLDRPELYEATARLAEVGVQSRAIADSFGREQEDILKLVDVVAQANRPIDELRRSIRMMGILAINARVVAASVSNLEDSDVFTTDIAELSSSAAKTIAEFSQLYDKLRVAVRQAAAARAQFEEGHSRSLAELSEKIGKSLDDLGRQRQRSADGSAETVAMARAIGQRVMTAVMALQVGDATRQRVEHIEAALTAAADADAETQRAIAELSAALLADAVKTLDADVEQAAQALVELARDTRQITARSHEVYGSAGSDGSVLSRLNSDMRTATMVLAACDKERRLLSQVAEGVEATVKVLLRHVAAVQHIEAEMRLVSLNAAIRCAQLGPDGAALNVISRQLRDLTSETVTAADTAALRLDEAAQLALAFSAASGEEAAERMARLESDAMEGLGLMDGVERRIQNALEVLADAGPRVAGLLEGASDGFADHPMISETLSDLQMRIVVLGQPESYTVAPDSPLASLLAASRKRYTMGAEREIHDAMWGKVAAPVVVAVGADADDLFEDFGSIAADVTAEAESDLGLDLFDADPPTQPEAPAADEPLGTVEDDVMFF